MAMSKPIMMISIFASVFFISSAQSCKNYTFSNDTNFESCKDLPVLEAHLHWNYDQSQKTIHVAYRAKQNPKGWIAWGINPTDSSMIGTQALVAFQDAKGKMKAYSTQITSYVPLMEPGPLSFPVSKLSAEYVDNEMIITAVLGPLMSNLTAYNAGNSVSDGIPEPHPFLEPNLTSLEMLDFLSV
ncbi:hypothetical protein Cgig2_022299 [Carnegiea gigantea]|uniref:DOMON domain-containing protein n=1 Tax=Carnegiea gigantea TaxID=171969 RepID=A0A9Q1QHN3_9CARY|nr:hypothetical protein Cgig2_022299 [Carnegiea gigantea]